MLRFAPLQSQTDVSFWMEYGERKLHEYKLSDTPVQITGWVGASTYDEVSSAVQVDASSFPASGVMLCDDDPAALPGGMTATRQGMHRVPGTLMHTNTMDALNRFDMAAALQEAASRLWRDIVTGACEQDPALLCPFFLLAHMDLKRYRAIYWCAFPALLPPAPYTVDAEGGCKPLASALGEAGAAQVVAACNDWRFPAAATAPLPGHGGDAPPTHHAPHPFWLLHSAQGDWTDTVAAPLSSWEALHSGGSPHAKTALAFIDPANTPGHPGWPLRNALVWGSARWQVPSLAVVCVRDRGGRTDAGRSMMLLVHLGEAMGADVGAVPKVVGWEVPPGSKTGKPGPHLLDLGLLLSPESQAEQAVDLNLSLMKWRAAPTLDTSRLSKTRCLLIGAGTLGCAVARTLLAWGVRHITLVDSSRVSFSNPVRQSLFEFQDSLQGGKPKAQAAAAALQRIFPSARTEGHPLSIPMPGHPPGSKQEAQDMQQAAEALDALVADHDVVFLLTDTRESRWLPTLLAAAYNKVAITSAVGFDSFVVMRHGGGPDGASTHEATDVQPAHAVHGGSQRLGCYFCNDVMAPANSTIDRALDQQCTVARPGLAPIAGAVAVEMMAAMVLYPDPVNAPTPSQAAAAASAHPVPPQPALGAVPHQVRGQLSGFSQTCLEGRAFDCCSGCSAAVVGAYRQRGWDMVVEALKDPRSLEQLTGLSRLHAQAEAAAAKLAGIASEGDGNEADAQHTHVSQGDVPAEDGEDEWLEL